MSELVINIKGEDINKMIAQAILDSTLGPTIKASVDKAITSLNEPVRDSWYTPSKMEDLLIQLIKEKIRELVNTEYKEAVEKLARNAIDKRLNEDLVGKTIDIMLSGTKGY